MFIDTHCHLNMMINKTLETPITHEQLLSIKNIVQESLQSGTTTLITIGTSIQESINAITIAKEFDNVYASVGIHPCDCTENFQKDLFSIKNLLKEKEKNKIVAIGETGLDFFHKPYNEALQERAFRAHIELACEYKLPLIFHVRNSGEKILKILEEYIKEKISGVFHCFLQSKEFAQTVTQWGFYFGIDAPITYPKNNLLREIIKTLPLDKIVLETDAPFLPPQELRGKQNSPAYISLFAPTLAHILNITKDLLAQKTTENAKKLFII
jgi:TatD DNase family protein